MAAFFNVARLRSITWVIAIMIAGGLCQHVFADHYDCYLLAGQSNMDGRGLNSDLSEAQKLSVKDAIIFYSNSPLVTENWQPLTPGYSRPPRFKDQLPSPRFGPEIGFVAEMRRLQPQRKIAIIKASEGGTNLRADWEAGTSGDLESQGRCYRNLVRTINTATAQLKSKGHTFRIKAMLWHQGESDSKANPESHQQRLTRLISRIRSDCDVANRDMANRDVADLNRANRGTADLPVVLGQVFDNGKRDKVRTAIQSTATAVDHVQLVTAEGLTTWDEGTHFDAASQLVLGQRFATQVFRMTNEESVSTSKTDSHLKVVCFGDSITKRGYPLLLADLLKADVVNAGVVNAGVVNAGVGGHTSRQGLHRIKKDVLDHNPDVVVILFGTNDMRVDSQKHVPIDDYKKNLAAMVAACQKINSKVILCSIPPINDQPYFTRHEIRDFEQAGGLQALVTDYGQAAAEICEQTGVPLVELQTLLKATPEWMHSDGVHPTDKGNQIIAEHIAKAVRQTVGRQEGVTQDGWCSGRWCGSRV